MKREMITVWFVIFFFMLGFTFIARGLLFLWFPQNPEDGDVSVSVTRLTLDLASASNNELRFEMEYEITTVNHGFRTIKLDEDRCWDKGFSVHPSINISSKYNLSNTILLTESGTQIVKCQGAPKINTGQSKFEMESVFLLRPANDSLDIGVPQILLDGVYSVILGSIFGFQTDDAAITVFNTIQQVSYENQNPKDSRRISRSLLTLIIPATLINGIFYLIRKKFYSFFALN